VYQGQIEINGKNMNVETKFTTTGGAITGSYHYGQQYQISRVFSNCSLNGLRLRCVWVEGDLSGIFEANFDASFRSFQGYWNFSNGRQGGSWNGNR
jgi:hypothetical protein